MRDGTLRGATHGLYRNTCRIRRVGHLLLVLTIFTGLLVGPGFATVGNEAISPASGQEVSPASSHDIPSTPASYHGTVNISGDVPNNGMVVEAVIDGAVRGTATVGPNGSFGGAPSPRPGQYLTVKGDDGDVGKSVSFYLNGPNVPRTAAPETVTWEDGDVQAIDLSAPIEPALPVLGNLSVAGQGPDGTIVQGDQANVTVDITNQGDIGSAFNLTLNISGQTDVTTSTGTLNGSERATLTFQNVTGALAPGVYAVNMSSGDETISGSLTVQIPGDPTPDLSDLNIAGQGDNAVVPKTKPNTISVNVTNIGPVGGALNTTLVISNQLTGATALIRTESTGSVTPGKTRTVTFTNVTDGLVTGFYNVAVARGTNTSNVELVGTNVVSVDVTGDGNPATDATGESLMSDVDGDSDFDIFDVQAFFVHHDDPIVQNNPNIFEFDGTPPVDIIDVQALFERLVEQSSFGSV